MGKIRILPDELVSKISAGEIVERPASVLKELLENSIDAGSTQIQVELKSGGKRLISVTDDGEGMTRDDALLSLERHATSKIRDIKDLFSVRTLGFRGEALPSISSVSRFRLTTRTKDEITGARITIEGGVIRSVEETGCPQGTTVEVRDLFYNTTPRLKFMKMEETELANILDIAEREMLSHPGIGFELSHEGRTMIRLPHRKAIEERLSEIFPSVELFPVEGEAEGIKMHGYLSSPEDIRTTTQKLYTYVNGRAVKDRFLTRMLIDSYGKMIEKGRFPQGVLFIETPHQEVDVNVHPTKNEVRFRRSRLVGDLIKASVLDMLRAAPWIKGYHEKTEELVPAFFERRESFDIAEAYKPAYPPQSLRLNEGSQVRNADTPPPSFRKEETFNIPHTHFAEPEPQSNLFTKQGFFGDLEVIGQVGELYIITASTKGLILIDQHAAHERINYERFKKSYRDRNIEMQELLLPIVVELSPYEAEVLRKQIEKIEALGIKVEEFGDRSFLIRSIPSIIKDVDWEKLLKDIIGEIAAEGEEKSLEELIDHVIATMACHGSIRASFKLSTEKMQALLQELDNAELPHFCPHGRPVAREITFEELERMFKRT